MYDTEEQHLTMQQQAAMDEADAQRAADAAARDLHDYGTAMRLACQAIRDCRPELMDAAFVSQVVHTLSAAAERAKLDKVADALDAAVVVFE